MKNKTKKILITVCSFAVLMATLSAAFFAIFANREKAETAITTGKIQVDLVEEFRGPDGDPYDPSNPDDPVRDPDDPDNPGPYEGDGAPEGTVKIIKGVNTGTQPAYVRARIFPMVETLTDGGEWITHGGIPANCIVYEQNESVPGSWIYSDKDDYWYYKYVLPVGETTSTIEISDLHLELPEYLQIQYGEDKVRVNMLVTLESTQASNGLYRQNWNIDNLPAGVEVMD